MRYRLRTLLFAVAIAGLLFGRMVYLKQQASTHRRAMENVVARLAPLERGSHDEIRDAIRFLASSGGPLTEIELPIQSTRIIALQNARRDGMVVQNEDSIPDWRRAVHHQIVAERFDRAVWRPWTFVSESVP